MLSLPGKIIKKYCFGENVLEALSQVGIRLVLTRVIWNWKAIQTSKSAW